MSSHKFSPAGVFTLPPGFCCYIASFLPLHARQTATHQRYEHPAGRRYIGAFAFVCQSVWRPELLSSIKRLNSNSVRSRTSDFTKGTHPKPRAVSFTAQCALLRSAPISQRHAPAGLLLSYAFALAVISAADSNSNGLNVPQIKPPIHRRFRVRLSVCGAEGAAFLNQAP